MAAWLPRDPSASRPKPPSTAPGGRSRGGRARISRRRSRLAVLCYGLGADRARRIRQAGRAVLGRRRGVSAPIAAEEPLQVIRTDPQTPPPIGGAKWQPSPSETAHRAWGVRAAGRSNVTRHAPNACHVAFARRARIKVTRPPPARDHVTKGRTGAPGPRATHTHHPTAVRAGKHPLTHR
jgi:hypothetical protein